MTSKKIISLVSVTALILISASAMAGKGRGEGKDRGFRGDKVARMVRHLDLTPDQEAKVRALHADHKSATKALRERVRALKDEIREAWQQEVPDEAAILALQKEIHEVKGALAEHRVRLRLDVMAILTPDQRERAEAHFRDRGKRGKGRGGKFQRDGKKGGPRGPGNGNGAL